MLALLFAGTRIMQLRNYSSIKCFIYTSLLPEHIGRSSINLDVSNTITILFCSNLISGCWFQTILCHLDLLFTNSLTINEWFHIAIFCDQAIIKLFTNNSVMDIVYAIQKSVSLCIFFFFILTHIYRCIILK